MTYGELKTVFEENEIPLDTTLYSDSGWECDATYIDCIYYSEELKAAVFMQYESGQTHYWSHFNKYPDKWVRLYNERTDANYPDWT